jgi:hypothetical protein
MVLQFVSEDITQFEERGGEQWHASAIHLLPWLHATRA